MASLIEAREQEIKTQPKRWLVTGCAGFIGSHLTEYLLGLGQSVVGVDNFATGKRENLDAIRQAIAPDAWARFQFIEGDLRDPSVCKHSVQGVHFVLHQAALGSVPRSLKEPALFHEVNVGGFVHLFLAARDAGLKHFVYASSSSVYGDEPTLPKVETRVGEVLSPYAATKKMNEIYASVYSRSYGMSSVGLRYFNVFGPRQDPESQYAAVIPKWIKAFLSATPIEIYGDGSTSRDFTYVRNICRLNLLAATTPHSGARIYNGAAGKTTSLNELFRLIRAELGKQRPELLAVEPVYRDFRAGDIRHSLADLTLVSRELGYTPEISVEEGLQKVRGTFW